MVTYRQPLNVDIEYGDDGNVLIAQEISDALQAKISWGFLPP
jgi:hypothetical protein